MEARLDIWSGRWSAAGAVAAVMLAMGCASGLEGPRTERDLVGYALPSCGPADGPAVEIYLSEDKPGPEAVPDSETLRVMVWESTQRLPGRSFSWSDEALSWGSVALCTSETSCVGAPEGVIRFDAAGDTVRGSYEIRRDDGSVQAGSFRAGMRERAVLCG